MDNDTDKTALFGFNAGLGRLTTENKSVKIKAPTKKQLRERVVIALRSKNATELKQAIEAGARLGGVERTAEGEAVGLVDLAFRFFDEDTLNVLLEGLSREGVDHVGTGSWSDDAFAAGLKNERALAWLAQKWQPADINELLSGAQSVTFALHDHATLATGVGVHLERVAWNLLNRFESVSAAEVRADEASREWFLRGHDDLVHALLTPILADPKRNLEAESGLSGRRLKAYLRKMFTINDGMDRMNAAAVAGVWRALKSPEQKLAFERVARRRHLQTNQALASERWSDLRREKRAVFDSLGVDKDRKQERTGGSPYALIPSVIGRLALFSAMRGDILGRPDSAKALVAAMVAPGGDGLLLSAVTRLSVPELSKLVRDHQDLFASHRDSRNNNIFHLVIGLRSGSRAMIDLAVVVDRGLLTEPNRDGFSVLDTLDGPMRIYAERAALKSDAKDSAPVKTKTRRRVM